MRGVRYTTTITKLQLARSNSQVARGTMMTVIVINIRIIISIETIITMICQHAGSLLPSLPCPPFPGSTRVHLAALLSLQACYGLWRRFHSRRFSACDGSLLDSRFLSSSKRWCSSACRSRAGRCCSASCHALKPHCRGHGRHHKLGPL